MLIREKTDTWRQDEEIRMINENLDFYVMEVSDEEFDTEEVHIPQELRVRSGGTERHSASN